MPPGPAAAKTGALSARAKQEGRGTRRGKPPRNHALKKKPEPKGKGGSKGGHKGARHRPGRTRRRAGKRRGRSTAASSTIPAVPDVGDGAHGTTCPICQETYCPAQFPVVHAPCGHVACASCSLTWQRKKSSRTCALCRSPVLSIAHCTQLEHFLVRRPEPGAEEGTPGASASSSCDVEISRADVKKGLQELSQGDLNFIPGDYRAHLVRQSAHRAVRKGDLTMLETCLRDFKVRTSTKLLCEVASLWKKEPRPVLSLLLAHGARMNGHPENRPLLHAVYCGNTRMVEALLEMKADPSRMVDGEAPLHVAVRRGRLEAVRFLLARGARTDEEDPVGRTPCTLAEWAWRVHEMSCAVGRSQCQRCAERWTIRNLLAPSRDSAAPAPAEEGRPPAPSRRREGQARRREGQAASRQREGQAPQPGQAPSPQGGGQAPSLQGEGQERSPQGGGQAPSPQGAGQALQPQGVGQVPPAQGEDQAHEDGPESEDSSSEWEEDGSDVSDMDDWASEDDDEDEEEEDGEEEEDCSVTEDDDDEGEDRPWRVMEFV